MGFKDGTANIQEQTIGRDKYEGAPLGGSKESDPLDLEAESGGKADDPRLLLHRRSRREPRRARSRPLLQPGSDRPTSSRVTRLTIVPLPFGPKGASAWSFIRCPP